MFCSTFWVIFGAVYGNESIVHTSVPDSVLPTNGSQVSICSFLLSVCEYLIIMQDNKIWQH